MSTPRVLVLRAAGINCNEETAFAFEKAGCRAEQVHLNRVLENPAVLDAYGGMVIPGGFSYGDDVAAGKILAIELSLALGDALRRFVHRGGLVLGICNGFQVLVKTGLLPGRVQGREVRATVAWNASRRYEDRWVRLKADGRRCAFVERDGTILELPVAHGEGRFLTTTEEDARLLQEDARVAFSYVDDRDAPTVAYPANPAGSPLGVAAVCDETGRVMGMMPHPERFLFPYQHPRWTRGPERAEGDGASIFRAAARAMR
ncbi:MAG TPA: phosphoribosylformylglycinamidine synthase I [Planctomycetota bacterium]|nr:phosphoribosylformylglycinamidine synthase I [Planctomycetota bacterium]